MRSGIPPAAGSPQWTPSTTPKKSAPASRNVEKGAGLDRIHAGEIGQDSKPERNRDPAAANIANTPGVALKQAFLAIDSEFLDRYGRVSATTGSCGLVCYVEDGAVWSAIVGDSRSGSLSCFPPLPLGICLPASLSVTCLPPHPHPLSAPSPSPSPPPSRPCVHSQICYNSGQSLALVLESIICNRLTIMER